MAGTTGLHQADSCYQPAAGGVGTGKDVQAADFDVTYRFDSIASGESGWDYSGPDGNNLHSEDTRGNWCWSNNSTPSSGVGPPYGQGGSGDGYIYTEASSPVAVNDEFTMTLSQAVDASAYALNCSFYRSMDFNGEPGELHFEVWNGSQWRSEGVWTGTSSAVWVYANIDLSSYTNSDLKVRFRTVVKGANTWTNDCAIDTVRIYGDYRAPLSYTITASAGLNGSISPEGAVPVAQGDDQPFTVTPNANYEVAELLVDGLPDTLTGGQYTFNNVNANHTISVTFALIPTGGDDDVPPSGCASNVSTD